MNKPTPADRDLPWKIYDAPDYDPAMTDKIMHAMAKQGTTSSAAEVVRAHPSTRWSQYKAVFVLGTIAAAGLILAVTLEVNRVGSEKVVAKSDPKLSAVPRSHETTDTSKKTVLPPDVAKRRTELLTAINAAREERLAKPGQAAPPSNGGKDKVGIGGESPEKILAAFKPNTPLFNECYENLLMRSPKASGKLTLDFVISAEPDIAGLVSEVNFVGDSDLELDDEFVGCVEGTAYSMVFDPPAEGLLIHVRMPLQFQPAKDEAVPPAPRKEPVVDVCDPKKDPTCGLANESLVRCDPTEDPLCNL